MEDLQSADCYRTGFCTIILIIHTRERQLNIHIYSSPPPISLFSCGVTQCAPRRHFNFKKLKFMRRENYKLQFITLTRSEMECGDFLLFSSNGHAHPFCALTIPHTLPLFFQQPLSLVERITSCYH